MMSGASEIIHFKKSDNLRDTLQIEPVQVQGKPLTARQRDELIESERKRLNPTQPEITKKELYIQKYPNSITALIEENKSRSTKSLLIEFGLSNTLFAAVTGTGAFQIATFVNGLLAAQPVIRNPHMALIGAGMVITGIVARISLGSTTTIPLLERAWTSILSKLNLSDNTTEQLNERQ